MANDDAIHDGRIDLATEVDVTSNAARFYSALHRFAVSLTRNESDAADLAQQTFLILAQRLHQIRDFSQIKCWLFTTLHREFLHKIRRGRKHFEVEFLPDIHDLATREPEPWRSLDGRIVLDALCAWMNCVKLSKAAAEVRSMNSLNNYEPITLYLGL